MLDIKNLYKSFGNFEVLHDISLTLKQGEILSILGNSGSGKSTLLRILARLEQPTSYSHFQCTSKTAIMFQNYALFPHLNVQENILFALHQYPKVQRNDRLDELLKLFNITSIRSKRIDQISGGQAQRVAFARAIATNCELLLLDEPFSNLDSNLKESLRKELKEMIKAQNISAIIVTHDIDDAYYLSDSITLLKQGKIIDHNTPKELYFNPKSAESQAFLPYINVITDTLCDDDPFFAWIRSKNFIFGANEIQLGQDFWAEVLEAHFLGAFNKLKLRYKHITFDMLLNSCYPIPPKLGFQITPTTQTIPKHQTL
ncbi:ABC transporter ATP-binding protein [Helicobacter pametensis]|uniref:ABC transporter ATP-binding protein n=1 Tax=Helicobacter pametensis TaxID=95149 RepID=UPI0004AD0181|nr:ABC transporter ATP-binding protein [Helicobacter pametensis]